MEDGLVRVPPVQRVDDPWLVKQGVQLSVLRLDLVHPTIGGNKWYKLKYNLLHARTEGHSTLLTVGGAYSNHLYATAAAGRAYAFKTIGIVRGEAHKPLNPTLRFAQAQGMGLHYVNREAFRQRGELEFQEQLLARFGRHYYLPEGGTNALAVRGCTEIVPAEPPFDYVACCVGTGGTLAGVLTSTAGRATVLGFPALKGGAFLRETVDQLTQQHNGQQYGHYRLVQDYHFGGYARVTPELVDFINEFYQTTGIPLEPVYTGKMMYGLYNMISEGYFPAGSEVLVIHSGGLQGIAGFNERYATKNLRIFGAD
jgi:1-aminocyclopropane-1-carboxylate deaminase/D-cysteine desulfhydrase-like pyridoxal-dependent ACC family enzyme